MNVTIWAILTVLLSGIIVICWVKYSENIEKHETN